MTKSTITNSDRLEMGIPLITKLTITSPREQDLEQELELKLQVMSGSSQFWIMCGLGMGLLTQLAGIGMAFLANIENLSKTTCWACFIAINIMFTLIEYFSFVFVSDIVRLQVAYTRQNEDMDALVNKWRTAFISGLVAGAVCVGISVMIAFK